MVRSGALDSGKLPFWGRGSTAGARRFISVGWTQSRGPGHAAVAEAHRAWTCDADLGPRISGFRDHPERLPAEDFGGCKSDREDREPAPGRSPDPAKAHLFVE